MALQNVVLKVGSVVWFSGERHAVIGIGASGATLKSMRGGEMSAVSMASLLTCDDFAFDDLQNRHDTSREAQKLPLPGIVSKGEQKKAMDLLCHVLEATTGFKSGNEQDAQPGEPKRQYNVSITTLSQRIDAKAKELCISSRALWQYKSSYASHGLFGLVDKRLFKNLPGTSDSFVSEAISKVAHRLHDQSNMTMKRVIALVQNDVRKQPNLPLDFKMPSPATIRRQLHKREDARQLFKSAKSRLEASNRPRNAYTRFHATRPGEIVLVDSTPLDAFVLDPVSLAPVGTRFTIAIDLYTRSIVGWRFSPTDTALDAALLLSDIISPKRSKEFFGGYESKPFVGIPKSIVTSLSGTEDEQKNGQLVPIPFLHPESLLIDHGKVYLSDTFLGAAAHLGINVMLARPYTPTDKAQVERMFRTIRENFVEALPGYKGNHVLARGKDPESKAFYFAHEIDEYFRQWVASYWQVRTHDGLFLSVVPTMELTPNQMLDEGIARAGFLHVLPDDNLRFQLLPVVQRKIHHYGVDVGLLRYDSADLDPYRNEDSNYPGMSSGKWPFRQDPRDKSVLYFYDQEEEKWKVIPWIGSKIGKQPFDEKILQKAKEIVFERTNEAPDRTSVEATLQELLSRVSNVSSSKRSSRGRLAAVLAKKAKQREVIRAEGGKAADEVVPKQEAIEAQKQWLLPDVHRARLFDSAGPGKSGSADRSISSLEDETPNENYPKIRSVDQAFTDDDDLIY